VEEGESLDYWHGSNKKIHLSQDGVTAWLTKLLARNPQKLQPINHLWKKAFLTSSSENANYEMYSTK
jgi:hypothetical protein